MAITTLWLTDFRCFSEGELLPPDPEGLTVLRGANGAGKTSVLEAVDGSPPSGRSGARRVTCSCAAAPNAPWCGPSCYGGTGRAR